MEMEILSRSKDSNYNRHVLEFSRICIHRGKTSRPESPFWNIKAGTNLIRNVSWHTRCVHAREFIRKDHRLAHYSCALVSRYEIYEVDGGSKKKILNCCRLFVIIIRAALRFFPF